VAKYPVKLIVAITFSESEGFTSGLEHLLDNFGEIDQRSEEFIFNHTDYYREEMGPDLRKQFFSFRELIEREQLIDIKQKTMEIEASFSVNEKRRVNIDPSYLELAKLVVASSKNYAHRIFLGKGVYGDVQMMFKKGCFVFNEWTYPDYRSTEVVSFMEQIRANYYSQLKSLS